MKYSYENLVFQGGGVKGIAYLGVLDVLFNKGILPNIKRVAGTSAGAVTATVASFNLGFGDIVRISNTLNYSKIPLKNNLKIKSIPENIINEFNDLFGDFECVYRLITEYGWYSTDYIYSWLRKVIASQFNYFKKKPPYTFADFKNQYIHKQGRIFKDLYIIGTDMTTQSSVVFSYENTPNMEVAEAVKISLSIPLFFESVNKNINRYTGNSKHIFSDGGIILNYPLEIFDDVKYGAIDKEGINMLTLGAKFIAEDISKPINNLLDYIESLFYTLLRAQDALFKYDHMSKERSIEIDSKNISATDFDIDINDEKYRLLYKEGKDATVNFLNNNKI